MKALADARRNTRKKDPRSLYHILQDNNTSMRRSPEPSTTEQNNDFFAYPDECGAKKYPDAIRTKKTRNLDMSVRT